MKKLWVIAMSLVSAIALAQHDQKQTPATESKTSQDSKTTTSKASSYATDEGTAEGSFKITFTAKTVKQDKDKSQTGMNAGERMQMDQSKISGQHSTNPSGTSNQGSASGNASTSAASNQNNNSGNQTPAATPGGMNKEPGKGVQDKTGASTAQNELSQLKSEESNVNMQQGAENQNTGIDPGLQNKPAPSSPNSILGNPSATAMQNNPAGTDYSSLSGKKVMLTLKNGKFELSDKEKSKPAGSSADKSNSSAESDVSTNSSSVTDAGTTVGVEGCKYNKTSGSGSTCTITASCSDNSTDKSYWSAYIDGNKITGSVSFVTAGGSTDYSFTGTRISGSKMSGKETSER